MKIPILSDWLAERRFDREHRPFLTTRYPNPVPLPDGTMYMPLFMQIYCTKHECFFGECSRRQ